MSAYDLDRFVSAQEQTYARALDEVRAGAKRSHWMWYVFPQIVGLGHSPMAQRFAISSVAEADVHLTRPVLGARLREITSALSDIPTPDAEDVFGGDLGRSSGPLTDASSMRVGWPHDPPGRRNRQEIKVSLLTFSPQVELDHCLARERDERAAAETATDVSVIGAHIGMAQRYAEHARKISREHNVGRDSCVDAVSTIGIASPRIPSFARCR